jgi:hypothetical protein
MCCYTRLQPDTERALNTYAPETELIDTRSSTFAYWEAIVRRWDGENDLIIIEHDIVIGPDTISSLTECPEPWCLFAFDHDHGRMDRQLGCTKISAAAQRQAHWLRVAALFESCPFCRGRGCWFHLDVDIDAALTSRGLQPHVHGEVGHKADLSKTFSSLPENWNYIATTFGF